ncbi:MAG: hypothetical protein ABSA12_00600 [Verrucomicrobiia bacterium]
MKKLFILSVLTMCCAITVRASVEGDNFEVQYFYPDLSTVYDSATTTVPGSVVVGEGINSVAISDGQIVISVAYANFTVSSFNGIVFTDLSKTPDFASLTLASVTGDAPYTDPVLSFTADTLSMNFSGVDNDLSPFTLTYDFTEGGSAVPEGSSTLMLLGMAMTGLACLRRRIG